MNSLFEHDIKTKAVLVEKVALLFSAVGICQEN